MGPGLRLSTFLLASLTLTTNLVTQVKNGDGVATRVSFPFHFLIFYLFIYLGGEQWGGVEGERDADSPLSRETEAGLYSKTLGS